MRVCTTAEAGGNDVKSTGENTYNGVRFLSYLYGSHRSSPVDYLCIYVASSDVVLRSQQRGRKPGDAERSAGAKPPCTARSGKRKGCQSLSLQAEDGCPRGAWRRSLPVSCPAQHAYMRTYMGAHRFRIKSLPVTLPGQDQIQLKPKERIGYLYRRRLNRRGLPNPSSSNRREREISVVN